MPSFPSSLLSDLLHALNAELNALVLPPQESQPEPEPEPQPESEPDFANAVYNELEVANKFELLKKMEEDLRAEQELVDKSALLMKMLEVSPNATRNVGRSRRGWIIKLEHFPFVSAVSVLGPHIGYAAIGLC